MFVTDAQDRMRGKGRGKVETELEKEREFIYFRQSDPFHSPQ